MGVVIFFNFPNSRSSPFRTTENRFLVKRPRNSRDYSHAHPNIVPLSMRVCVLHITQSPHRYALFLYISVSQGHTPPEPMFQSSDTPQEDQYQPCKRATLDLSRREPSKNHAVVWCCMILVAKYRKLLCFPLEGRFFLSGIIPPGGEIKYPGGLRRARIIFPQHACSHILETDKREEVGRGRYRAHACGSLAPRDTGPSDTKKSTVSLVIPNARCTR